MPLGNTPFLSAPQLELSVESALSPRYSIDWIFRLRHPRRGKYGETYVGLWIFDYKAARMRVEGAVLASFMLLQFQRQPEVYSTLIKEPSVTLDIIGLVSPPGIQPSWGLKLIAWGRNDVSKQAESVLASNHEGH
jgi:hypothetical protein